MSIFPTKILLATDGSREAKLAANTAIDLANSTNSELHVVYVGEAANPYVETVELAGDEQLSPRLDTELKRQFERQARERLEVESEGVRAAGGTVAHAHLRMGKADHEIVALAEDIGAGLIVVGSRGRGGIRRALMGSVSDSVVRHAHCPVLVMRRKPVNFPAKILLATDGSEEATLAARTAADLAQRTSSELHVVTVAPEYHYVYETYDAHVTEEVERSRQEAQKVLDEQAQKVSEAGVTVSKTHLKVGAAGEEIIVLAEEESADLIVMGSRGLGGMRRALMGSVSDSVVRHVHCPVMVVRP